MRKIMLSIAAAGAFFASAAYAQAACPNQSPSITIPMVGEATLTAYDSVTCNPLVGPFTISIPGGSLSASTKPAFTLDSAGVLHFTANGAPFGTRLAGTVIFVPDTSRILPLMIIVGGSVTGIVGGTTTP